MHFNGNMMHKIMTSTVSNYLYAIFYAEDCASTMGKTVVDKRMFSCTDVIIGTSHHKKVIPSSTAIRKV